MNRLSKRIEALEASEPSKATEQIELASGQVLEISSAALSRILKEIDGKARHIPFCRREFGSAKVFDG